MPTIEVITDLAAFRALREDWNALVYEADASMFQTWEWSWNWWRANSRGKSLLIVAVRDGSRLLAVAPLYISTSYLGLPIRVISFLGTGGTDSLDFIAHRGKRDSAVVLVDYLFDLTGWDAIDLHQLPGNGMMAELMQLKAVAAGLVYDRMDQDACYSLALPSSWEEYIAGLSKKFRWNLQYYTRRLKRDYEIAFRLSNNNSVKEDIELFFRLHQKRFLNKKKPGAYLNPKFRKFHASLAVDLCESGWLRLYFLEIHGQAVAALYGFQFSDSFYYYLGGFEPDWGAMSVSTVLIGRSIEDSIAEGLSRFDFLRGQEPYKQKWLALESHNYRLIISHPGRKSGLVQRMLSLENDLTKRAKDIIIKS
ncbi:MAG: GNAT family N-acetyltransferase [Actinobacteria bacterium]|nr:GNAT family N-acetyltransferase [Actinomycetota bacterium]